MEAELAALASSGATALVGAMATDGWEQARSGMGRLLGRGRARRQAAVEDLLDDDAELLAAAPLSERARTRDALTMRWQQQVESLLIELPQVAEELRALAARLAERSAGEEQQQRSVRQDNHAHHGGTVFAVLDGTMNVSQGAAPGPGPLEEPDPGPAGETDGVR